MFLLFFTCSFVTFLHLNVYIFLQISELESLSLHADDYVVRKYFHGNQVCWMYLHSVYSLMTLDVRRACYSKQITPFYKIKRDRVFSLFLNERKQVFIWPPWNIRKMESFSIYFLVNPSQQFIDRNFKNPGDPLIKLL